MTDDRDTPGMAGTSDDSGVAPDAGDGRDADESGAGTSGGRDADGSGETPAETRRARVETAHGDGETATMLARALRPDNTDEMDTRVEGDRLVTTIERGTTGGLQSTVDDYVVNLQTGAQVVAGEDSAADGETTESGRATASTRESERNHNTDSAGDTSSRDTSENTTETDNE